jgi:hypothetical protein
MLSYVTLRYESNDCLHEKKTFGKYIDFLHKIKLDGNPEIKPFLSILWGAFAAKSKTTYRTTKGKQLEINCNRNDIIQITPLSKDVDIIVVKDTSVIFKNPFARCSVFLTAYCRLKMCTILLNLVEDIDDIVAVNTDGFVCLSKPAVEISNEIGDFKIAVDKVSKKKRSGTCTVKNCNHVTFA